MYAFCPVFVMYTTHKNVSIIIIDMRTDEHSNDKHIKSGYTQILSVYCYGGFIL